MSQNEASKNEVYNSINSEVDFRQFMRKVGAGVKRSRDLTIEESRQAASMILSGRATPAQAGAFLIALRVKEETPEELAGFALAVRDYSTLQPSLPSPLVDCAGAYDGRVRTIPVGVVSALVAHFAGVNSLFHGIQGLGRSGVGPAEVIRALADERDRAVLSGVHYLDQLDYCPALAALKPLRNELGLRTAFNTAEKLVNLGTVSGSRSTIVGVFHGPYLQKVAEAAVLLKIDRVLVIQGLEGSDDLQITRDSKVCELRDGEIRRWSLEPGSLGLPRWPATALDSPGFSFSMQRIREALVEKSGPVADAIILNTSLRLYLAGKAETMADGAAQARNFLAQDAGSASLDGFRGA